MSSLCLYLNFQTFKEEYSFYKHNYSTRKNIANNEKSKKGQQTITVNILVKLRIISTKIKPTYYLICYICYLEDVLKKLSMQFSKTLRLVPNRTL